jgi:superfamily II DNA or RNA helicase
MTMSGGGRRNQAIHLRTSAGSRLPPAPERPGNGVLRDLSDGTQRRISTRNYDSAMFSIAPGSVVIVRDEEWLVIGVEHTTDGRLLRCQGLSELVRDTTASFYEGLDTGLHVLDPAEATVVADDSPHYRRSRLWLEATLRKTAVPLDGAALTVSVEMLANPLGYQQAAVRKALDQANLRTRILLADAVGLGKTLEIGMILSELIRRGRGERILIVTPRHVLEQMQNEMWSRFAIPFVRLDTLGIQRVRQKLPATRNPFSYFKRVIISIDTLKSRQYLDHLRRQPWDAVVIDESHNVTNYETLNNKLARVLAPNTDALILASATPHNGKPESFAELIRLLEPTAVRPDGTVIEEEVRRLVIRRHRHSPEVASEVGADWAERKEPQNWLVPASESENEVARELDEVWLHPASDSSPYSGSAATLFPWTLAKAFLSSPAALLESIKERIGRLDKHPAAGQEREIEALLRLEALARKADDTSSGKYTRLLAYLHQLSVGPDSPIRVVIFAERVRTLKWLREHLEADLRLGSKQAVILHGGLTDQEQQDIVESFKKTSSPIRVLITGDLASEGVNLHEQCYELIHYDIPWSLIRIEQRNGRIDRYGQQHPPQITTLLLNPETEAFSGDLRVLSRLIEKEHEAHSALGDAASLMGKYDVGAEEDEIRKVLAGKASLDEVVKETQAIKAENSIAGMLARIMAGAVTVPGVSPRSADDATARSSLYPSQVAFLEDALNEAFKAPAAPVAVGGVGWRDYGPQQIVELIPPPDLRQRLEVLPQSYLAERKVIERFKLVTSKARGKALLADALTDESDSSWPEAHYLGPLHPVIDWAADRAMATLGRNQVFVARGEVDHPTILLLGTLTNRRGQVVASSYLTAEFPNPGNPAFCIVTPHESATAMVAAVGYTATASNPGPVAGKDALRPLIAYAVQSAAAEMAAVFAAAQDAITGRVEEWSRRVTDWTLEADALIQRSELRQRRVSVQEEQAIAARMVPERQLIRPLLIVVSQNRPVAGSGEEE